jgi:uncharacterized protein (DUF1697 family)
VIFERELAPDAVRALVNFKGPERVKPAGKDLYLHYRAGIARSKLNVFIDKTIEARGTARNWTTVNKLLQICSALERTSA